MAIISCHDSFHEVSSNQHLPRDLLQEWLAMIRNWRQDAPCPGAQRLAPAIYRLETAIGPIVIKRLVERGVKALLSITGLREPQLQRAFRLGLRATTAALRTPAPLLYTRRQRGTTLETVLITPYVAGSGVWHQLNNRDRGQAVLESLGREIADWHAQGLRDRDLKHSNILCATDGEPWIIDLGGVHEALPHPSDNIRARDLGRLKSGALVHGIDKQQWQWLLTAYLKRCTEKGMETGETPWFLRAIEQYVKKKLARNRRHHRPVH